MERNKTVIDVMDEFSKLIIWFFFLELTLWIVYVFCWVVTVMSTLNPIPNPLNYIFWILFVLFVWGASKIATFIVKRFIERRIES